MGTIIVVDDDPAISTLCDSLRYRGHEVTRIHCANEALGRADDLVSANLLVLDVIMPFEGPKGTNTSTGGMEVFREIRKRSKVLPIIAFTALQDAAISQVLEDDPATTFVHKWGGPSLKDLIRTIEAALGHQGPRQVDPPFIVHGQDDQLKLAVKNYLQNTLRLPEPIILHEQANQGRTIIEKFEDYAVACSMVFVLLSPDDKVVSATDTPEAKRRARQNVIFELGLLCRKVAEA